MSLEEGNGKPPLSHVAHFSKGQLHCCGPASRHNTLWYIISTDELNTFDEFLLRGGNISVDPSFNELFDSPDKSFKRSVGKRQMSNWKKQWLFSETISEFVHEDKKSDKTMKLKLFLCF